MLESSWSATAAATLARAGKGILRRAPFELPGTVVRFVPGIVTFAVVATIGFAGGGLLPRMWRMSLLALLALAAAALVARDRIEVGRREVAMFAALALLAAWTAAAWFWSDIPANSLPECERTLVYVGALLAVFVGAERRSQPQLLGGVLAGTTAASAYGLVKYVFWPPPLNPFEGKLLFEPFGYANAVGIYAAIGIILAVGLGLTARTAWRAAALAPLTVLVPTLFLTSSRGAWAALSVGLVVMLYVGGRIRSWLILPPLFAASLIGGILLGSNRGQAFSLVGQNRPNYWHVAWADYKANPLLGSGPGTFGNYWLHHRPTLDFVQDAHNLYLETLAELGPIGLALLLVALVLPLLALRGRRDMFVATAAGAYVAFILHAAIDWDWEMPAVTVVGFALGAALLLTARSRRVVEIGPYTRATILLAAAALASFAAYRL